MSQNGEQRKKGIEEGDSLNFDDMFEAYFKDDVSSENELDYDSNYGSELDLNDKLPMVKI